MMRLPHLETDVTTLCQLSCVACNHCVPLWRKLGPWSANPRQVERDLDRLARFVHVDAWGALGGEPTLHPRLVSILHAARSSGIADKIEVWTNGLRLRLMPADFWRSFDVLVLSVYPDVLTDAGIDWIRRKCEDSGVSLAVKDERTIHNFRSLVEPRSDDARTRAKHSSCFFRGFSRVANDGYFYTCCVAAHLPVALQGRPRGSDGVAIDGALTEEALSAYLAQLSPLECCRVCAGRDTARPVVWDQERDPVRWIVKSGGGQ